MRKIAVHIGPTIVIRADDLTPGAEHDLRARLTYENPEFRPGSKTVSEFLTEYEETTGDSRWLRLPRGAVALLRSVLERHQYEITWKTASVVSRSRVHLDPLSVDPKLRDYQLAAAKALLHRVQGVFECPTGGGKTRTMSAAIVASGEPSIVFVHSEDLLKQWLEAFTMLRKTPRVIQGGDSDASPLRDGEIAVAMIQTVAENVTRFSPLLQSAGLTAFDECHHNTAASWRVIAKHCPARFRWGCTATPDRDDGLGFLLDLLIGPIVYRVKTKELIARGFLSAPRFIPIATGWAPGIEHYFAEVVCPNPLCSRSQRTTVRQLKERTAICRGKVDGRNCGTRLVEKGMEVGRLNYTEAQTDVSSDPGVQALVGSLVEMACAAGRSTLVLVPRREAVKEITEALRDLGISAIGVTSGVKRREEAIAKVRDGTYAAIVATTLADEGLDIPRLDFGINLMSGKSSGRARQRTGRLLRPVGEAPIQVELIHDGEEYGRQWDRRMSAYVKEYGKTSILRVVPGGIDDVADLLKRTLKAG